MAIGFYFTDANGEFSSCSDISRLEQETRFSNSKARVSAVGGAEKAS
jgi:hypothetical protein